MDTEKIRRETPGCETRAHFNNAGAGLMPLTVVDTITSYIELESRVGGYEAQAQKADEIDSAYKAIARLLGTSARNVAFTENATASYMQALSSIDFKEGDVILTTRHDYSSNQIQFLSLKKRFGIEIVRAPDRDSGGVDVDAIGGLIEAHNPRMVCVTEIPTNSGLVQDVYAIGGFCRDGDVVYLVDACQSVGQKPVDVEAMGCDFLSATSRKFLRGPRGSGFLYVSDRILDAGYEPLFIDMLGANWSGPNEYVPVGSARRFENWEFAWALVLACGAAADYANRIGLDAIWERVVSMAAELRSQLAELPGYRVLDKGELLGGIVTAVPGDHDPFDVVARLREQGINTSAQAREYAVIDYDEKNVSSALRISPHYYNNAEDVSRLLAALRQL